MGVHFSELLDTNGDGTGTTNAVGNYAASPTPFFIRPAAAQTLEITRLILLIEDSGVVDAAGYGAGNALSNGVVIRTQRNGRVETNFTEGLSIKRNAEYCRLMYDVDLKDWGNGNKLITGRFTFAKLGGPVRLSGPTEILEVVLNDSMVHLVSQYFTVQGTAY